MFSSPLICLQKSQIYMATFTFKRLENGPNYDYLFGTRFARFSRAGRRPPASKRPRPKAGPARRAGALRASLSFVRAPLMVDWAKRLRPLMGHEQTTATLPSGTHVVRKNWGTKFWRTTCVESSKRDWTEWELWQTVRELNLFSDSNCLQDGGTGEG